MKTKEMLLARLKAKPGEWISGAQFSNQLGISRTAIWKHMNRLKADGHQIDSAPKKGYRLLRAADLMLPDEILAGLGTHTIGRGEQVYLNETDSTNMQAKSLASNGAAEGTLVVAESQTGGRGRRGRTWFSPSFRNIYTSIILRPPMAPDQAPQITLMTAVAVARTLRRTAQLDAKIKWPNDILINGKKIAGILTELSADMDVVDHVVVGMGINVNVTESEIPADIRDMATSVKIANGRSQSRVALLCALLNHFEQCYDQLKTEGFGPLMIEWRRMSDTIGQQVRVDVLNNRFTGVVVDVDDSGVLVLKDDKGRLHRIFSGDVTRLRKT